MPTTEIPPRNPATPSETSRSQAPELYDGDSWESAYRETYDVPALLVQLQDDLSRSRQREAFWISVVVHLTLIILLVNSEKFDRLWNHKPLVAITPRDMMLQKELTYLQLPPDEQKLTKRPETNNISDKDRIATSKQPRLDREELKKILDANKRGMPGPAGPPSPTPQPSEPAPTAAQAPPGPPSAPPPAPKPSVAQLQPPRLALPKPSFANGMSAGSAIEQAARAALANRGGYGGDDGNYGLGQGQAAQAVGNLDILSDTMGVDFGPYLKHVVDEVRQNWYNLIPESARAPLMKKGRVSIQFAIMKDGSVSGMSVTEGGSSGDVALDRAAWAGITASNPFPPLPDEFGGQYLALRFRFYYNPDKNEMP